MTNLTQREIDDFWIRVYLGTSNNDKIKYAVIERAYRDFNRTLHGIGKIQTEEKYQVLKDFMFSLINELILKEFKSQNEFDEWHKLKCDQLKLLFVEILSYPIYYGQAQKWINMTLKYLFALGDDKIKGIIKNYHLFHIPIDNIILKKLALYNIPSFSISWSRIDNYNDYLDYQIKVREIFINQIPMDVEFRIFNID